MARGIRRGTDVPCCFCFVTTWLGGELGSRMVVRGADGVSVGGWEEVKVWKAEGDEG